MKPPFARQVGDVHLQGLGLLNHAEVHLARQHYERAREDVEACFQSSAEITPGGNQKDSALDPLAGIVLTGGLRPINPVLKVIHELPYPVLLAQKDSYEVASAVHDLTVKTRPDDLEKITAIRDLIARHVDVSTLLTAIK